MSRELKTIQWNIGGGKILADGQDPERLSSYSEEGIEHIIDVIGTEEPDIVTLQETHPSQPAEIASALGYKYWVNHAISQSHIDPGHQIGHGLVSRLPVKHDTFEEFANPLWKTDWEDGTKAVSHPKGISTYDVELAGDELLLVQNLHLIPFRRFGIDQTSADAAPVLRDVEAKVGRYAGKRLLQGDFNLNAVSLRPLLPGLFEADLEEVEQEEATTPKGHRIDHVLFAGVAVVKSVVVKSVFTDHYPIVTTFEL